MFGKFKKKRRSLLLRRIPSVEQTSQEVAKAIPTTTEMTATSTNPLNSQNASSNRRELPNVPRSASNSENKIAPTTNATQNSFFNTGPTNSNGTTRSSPSQWMGNIGQTIRRQTTNTAEVKTDFKDSQ